MRWLGDLDGFTVVGLALVLFLIVVVLGGGIAVH